MLVSVVVIRLFSIGLQTAIHMILFLVLRSNDVPARLESNKRLYKSKEEEVDLLRDIIKFLASLGHLCVNILESFLLVPFLLIGRKL